LQGESDEEDFRNDPLVRIAAEILDPRHTDAVPPTSITAMHLLQRADRQRRGGARRRLRLLGMAAAAVAVAVTIVAVAKLLPSNRTPAHLAAPIAAASAPTTPTVQPTPVPMRLPGGDAPAARPHLVDMVTRVKAFADHPAPLRYTYIHTMTWTQREAGGVRDEQLWWAADRSGRQVVTEAGGDAAGAGTPPGGELNFQPGGLAVVVADPSGVPAILAAQLAAYRPLGQGPEAALRAVVDLFRFHAMDAAHRAAAIRVLADTTGLLYPGAVTDPLGRAGVAISVNSDGGATRDVAVFDPQTGQLLSYERDALQPATATPIGVVEYLVLVSAGYADELGVPTSTPIGTK
jgi:hypothetical protein